MSTLFAEPRLFETPAPVPGYLNRAAAMFQNSNAPGMFDNEDADGDMIDPFADEDTAPATTGNADTTQETHTMQTATTPMNGTNGTHSPAQPNAEEAQAIALRSIGMGLLGLVNNAKPAVDADQVKAMIDEALTGAMASVKPRSVAISVNNAPPVEMDDALPSVFHRLVTLAAIREDIMLIGPTGSGKTHCAALVAKALSLPFGFVSVSAGMSEGTLLGRLLPTGDHGRMEYHRSEFVRLYEEGGVFLLDEMDAADPNTLISINMALSNGRMAVPARTNNPTAQRHPDFICIAAANTFGMGTDRQYVGREQLDAATLERFLAARVFCDYDANVENALCSASILAWGRAMREKINAAKMRRNVSTRFLIKGSKQLAAGIAWSDLMDSFFMDWKDDERAKMGDLASKEYTPSN